LHEKILGGAPLIFGQPMEPFYPANAIETSGKKPAKPATLSDLTIREGKGYLG
jgi:hypothetical protein